MSETMRIDAAPWAADFLLSEANLYRSREVITVPQGDDLLPPGSFVTMAGAAATAGDADAILMYPVDPRHGPVPVTVIARDAEVNDAYLAYGDLDRDAVNARLAEHGIIVRHGVLPDAIVTPSSGENLWSQTPAATQAAQAPPATEEEAH